MSLPPFNKSDTIILQPMQNAGWIISIRDGDDPNMARIVAAYTTAEDMLTDLNAALSGNVSVPE